MTFYDFTGMSDEVLENELRLVQQEFYDLSNVVFFSDYVGISHD